MSKNPDHDQTKKDHEQAGKDHEKSHREPPAHSQEDQHAGPSHSHDLSSTSRKSIWQGEEKKKAAPGEKDRKEGASDQSYYIVRKGGSLLAVDSVLSNPANAHHPKKVSVINKEAHTGQSSREQRRGTKTAPDEHEKSTKTTFRGPSLVSVVSDVLHHKTTAHDSKTASSIHNDAHTSHSSRERKRQSHQESDHKNMELLGKLARDEEREKKKKEITWRPRRGQSVQEKRMMAHVPAPQTLAEKARQEAHQRNAQILREFRKTIAEHERREAIDMQERRARQAAKARASSSESRESEKTSEVRLENPRSKLSIIQVKHQKDELRLSKPDNEYDHSRRGTVNVPHPRHVEIQAQESLTRLTSRSTLLSHTHDTHHGDHAAHSPKKVHEDKAAKKFGIDVGVGGEGRAEKITQTHHRTAPQVITTHDGRHVTLQRINKFPGAYHVQDTDRRESKKKHDVAATTVGVRKIINDFRKTKEDEKFSFKRLRTHNIPYQKNLMKALLEDDPYKHNFNGFIREYYSHVLRSYCVMNMQERYRGLDPTSQCLKVIDLTKMYSKETFQRSREIELIRQQETYVNKFREVASDTLHFRFLKELARTQALTLPLSVMYDILEETKPAVGNVWNFYNSKLGKNHPYSLHAGQHYYRLFRRHEMYQHLGFGDTEYDDED